MIARMWRDVRALVDDDDVDLHAEAAPWIIALRHSYEFFLLAAAVFAAYLIVVDETWALTASWVIWAWFATDYAVRFYVANDRRHYVRTHRLELLAALPIDFLRPLRLLRIVRPLAMISRATKGMRDVLGLEGFTLIGSVGICVVLLGGALLSWIEPETVPTMEDGMWWSLVTTTTVGYGDISPTTGAGRFIAGVLMVSGIGLLGAVTGEVAERLTRNNAPTSTGDAEVDHLIGRLTQWPELGSAERRRLATVLDALVDNDPTTPEEGTA